MRHLRREREREREREESIWLTWRSPTGVATLWFFTHGRLAGYHHFRLGVWLQYAVLLSRDDSESFWCRSELGVVVKWLGSIVRRGWFLVGFFLTLERCGSSSSQRVSRCLRIRLFRASRNLWNYKWLSGRWTRSVSPVSCHRLECLV